MTTSTTTERELCERSLCDSCWCEITSADYEAGACTNCGHELEAKAMSETTTTQTRITGPHLNRLKWGIEVYEGRRWIEVAATEGSRRDAQRLEREVAKERLDEQGKRARA